MNLEMCVSLETAIKYIWEKMSLVSGEGIFAQSINSLILFFLMDLRCQYNPAEVAQAPAVSSCKKRL